MKSVLLILGVIILVSCGSKGGGGAKVSHRDTSYPLAIFMGYQLKGIEQSVVRKVTIHDTLVWEIGKDSASAKKRLLDSVYYDVPATIKITDVQSAKAFNIPIRDSSKIDTIISRVFFATQKHVREFPNWDSTLAELRRMIVVDTTKK